MNTTATSPIRPRKSMESLRVSDHPDPLGGSAVSQYATPNPRPRGSSESFDFPPEVDTPVEKEFYRAAREREEIAVAVVDVHKRKSPKWWWWLLLPLLALAAWFMWSNAGAIAATVARGEIKAVSDKVDGVVGKADSAVSAAQAAVLQIGKVEVAVGEVSETAAGSAELANSTATQVGNLKGTVEINGEGLSALKARHDSLQARVQEQLAALAEGQTELKGSVREIKEQLDAIPDSDALRALRADVDALLELQIKHTAHLRRVETALARHIQGRKVRIERPGPR